MATKTRVDLVTKALANLGVTEAGQPPSFEDASTVDGYVETTLATISAKGIVTIGDDNAIPMEFFQPLAVLLAQDCAHEFGLPGVPTSPQNPNPVMKAETDLRIMNRGQPTGERLQAEYF